MGNTAVNTSLTVFTGLTTAKASEVNSNFSSVNSELGNIGSANLIADAVLTAKIKDGQVTGAKLTQYNGVAFDRFAATACPRLIQNLFSEAYSGSTNIAISADCIALTDGSNWILVSAVSKTLSTLAAAGLLGIDQGSFAVNTTYHIYIVSKADGTVSVMCSTSSSAPSFTNASGYSFYRRVGAFRTSNGSATIPLSYTQKQDRVWFHDAKPVSAAVTFVGSTPTGVVGAGQYAIIPATAKMITVCLFASQTNASVAGRYSSIQLFSFNNGGTQLGAMSVYDNSAVQPTLTADVPLEGGETRFTFVIGNTGGAAGSVTPCVTGYLDSI